MVKRIITISREFGSGGRFIGEEVAKKLGIAYYDKNIINEIAEKSGLSPEYVLENAELSPKKGLFALVDLAFGLFVDLCSYLAGLCRRFYLDFVALVVVSLTAIVPV